MPLHLAPAQSTPPDPPTKKLRSMFLGLTSVVVGFGLPIWIIYSQVSVPLSSSFSSHQLS